MPIRPFLSGQAFELLRLVSCGWGANRADTQTPGAKELSQMATTDQYREFAAECFRLASEMKTEEHRNILLVMARAWKELAEEEETKQSRSLPTGRRK
jgi:hypothetical protein